MYNAIWVELCRVLPIWYSLQDHNWKYSLSYLGLELSFQNWPLFEPLGCFAVFFCLGFLVVSLPAASFPPVLYICIDLKGLQAKLRHVLGYSLVTFQVTLCCWFPWELVSPLWSALECLIYLCACFQPVSLAPVSFPSRRAGVPVCMAHKLSAGRSLGVGRGSWSCCQTMRICT